MYNINSANVDRAGKETKPAFKLGNVAPNYVSGKVAIKFDGQDAASSKLFSKLSSYTPTAGDRVIMANVGNTYIILGKVD